MTTTTTENQTSASAVLPVTLWVGLDWADRKHCLVVRRADGGAGQTHWIDHKPQHVDEFFLELRQKHPEGVIGVVLEQSRGPVLYSLLKYSFLRLYPVNPRCLADFRKAFKASGAKADPPDADLLSDMGCKHSDRLRALELNDPETRKLVLMTEQRREVVDQQTALSNQLTAALKCYYPLALELFGDNLVSPMCLAFLKRWPNLAAVQQAKPTVLRAFFYAQRSRSEEKIKQRLEAIAQARPLTEDEAIISVMQLQVETLIQRVKAVQEAISRYEERIGEVFASHAKANVFASFPGAGPALAPRLAAAFGTMESNFPRPQDMLAWSGVAPVKQQSGKSKVVMFRYARSKFLHQTFVEFARVSVQFSDWARVLYDALRAKDWKAYRIYRYIAFKWVRIMWRCWKEGTAYDETRYLQGLKKRGVKLYESLYETAESVV